MMNKDLIAKALRFHGQPLQKIWAGERGDHDLYQLGLANPDFSVYFERQKDLTFQDRAKRLKLHQFLARKANELFDRDLQSAGVNTALSDSASTGSRQDASETIVAMPPYEYFLNTSAHEKSKVFNSTLEAVAPGQIVYGIVTKPYTTGTQVKVLCTREPLVRYLADIHIRALLPSAFMVPGHDKKGVAKAYAANDFVCCEVLDISVDADRMTLGMKGVLTKDASAPLGLISLEQIPDYYRRIISDSDDNFQDYLFKSKTFNNTNCYEMLYKEVGLDINETYSHMRSLKYRFPTQDYAIELRQTQASKWAFRSVADGIEHFKIGRHVEAFQCLNKALSIDPRNVEGLVARGALYANKGSFKKAVEDFETALKLNSFHANARKYMGETLVALGRSYEEENQMEEAVKAYQNCLNIIPNHEQARISLDALKRRPGQMNQVIDINMLSIPGSSDFKKKKKSKHKSSSSSSSADDSSDSSSDSHSSGETSSDSDNEKQKKKARKQKSLSPLSKRMGDMNSGNVGSNFELSQPFYMMQKDGKPDYNKMDDILTGDDDYETRVQKLLKDASKHRKQREGKSSGSKKKSKKKRKKAKKEAARLEKKATKEANSLANAFEKPPTDEVNLNESLEKYERSLMELQKFQQSSVTTTAPITTIDLDNDEEPPPAPSFKIRTEPAKRISPPPKAPKISIRIQNTGGPSTARPQPPVISNSAGRTSSSHFDSNYNKQVDTSFKPFPIKGPVVLDKFGCFRLAVPNPEDVEALTRQRRSRSRSKPRLYSRTNIHCHSKSDSRSRSRSNHRGRRGRSKSTTRRRSKSLTRHRSKSTGRYRSKSPSHRSNSKPRRRSRSRGRRSPDRRGRSPRRGGRSPPRKSRASPLTKPPRRRAPSPFDPNRRPRPGSPSDRRRRSRSPDRRSGLGNRGQKVFGNRVWQRPAEGDNGANGNNSPSETPKPPANSAVDSDGPKSKAPSGIDGRWKHDKFVKEDGISLEEIDKIITQAKKERKEEILQRDKKILKKNPATGF